MMEELARVTDEISKAKNAKQLENAYGIALLRQW
jgi:hypothetical protein